MLTAICKLLKREQHATFYNNLLDLVNSLKNIVASINRKSIAYLIIICQITELQAIISHVNRLLSKEEGLLKNGILTVTTLTKVSRVDLNSLTS
jgi:hypothetical protein